MTGKNAALVYVYVGVKYYEQNYRQSVRTGGLGELNPPVLPVSFSPYKQIPLTISNSLLVLSRFLLLWLQGKINILLVTVRACAMYCVNVTSVAH